jgi:hypothetical protein
MINSCCILSEMQLPISPLQYVLREKLVSQDGGYAKINENRKQVLNRYEQHTQHCSSCRGALKNIQTLQLFLLAYFAVVVAIVAVLTDTLRMKVGILLIISALFGLGIYAILKLWLEPKFYFVDYIHAEK